MAYRHIATSTLGSDSGSIVLSGIPQDGTSLIVRLSARDTDTSNGYVYLRVNENSNSAAYYRQSLYYLTVADSFANGDLFVGASSYFGADAGIFGQLEIVFPNYSVSGETKSYQARSGIVSSNGYRHLDLLTGHFSGDVNPITTLRLVARGQFLAGTSISLYYLDASAPSGASVTTS